LGKVNKRVLRILERFNLMTPCQTRKGEIPESRRNDERFRH
jgi:hypothetical protein